MEHESEEEKNDYYSRKARRNGRKEMGERKNERYKDVTNQMKRGQPIHTNHNESREECDEKRGTGRME